MDSEEKLYAIREVSEITGVKPVTLRAWQRRYHLLEPKRTEKGHRLFNEQDVQTIQTICHWLAKGISIGKVAQLIKNASEEENVDADPGEQRLDECEVLLDALSQLNRGSAEGVIASVFQMYPSAVVEQQFIAPMMNILEQMRGSQKSLCKGLFQSLMLSQLSWMITVENKSSSLGQCLCISFDAIGSLWAWVQAATLAEQGYFTVLLDGADDISGLSGHLREHHYVRVDFFSNKALTMKQQQAIRLFNQEYCGEVTYSGLLAQLHQSWGE